MLSCLMGAVVFGVELIFTGAAVNTAAATASMSGRACLMLLAIQILAGVIVYTGGALILKMESLRYLIETIKQLGNLS